MLTHLDGFPIFGHYSASHHPEHLVVAFWVCWIRAGNSIVTIAMNHGHVHTRLSVGFR
jgi:hypothetical protein